MEPDVLDSSPNPSTTAIVIRVLRWAITLAAGAGFISGDAITDHTVAMAGSSIAGLVTVAWTVTEAVRNARHTHAVAVASATRGRAVQPLTSRLR